MRYTADPQVVVQQPGTTDPLKQVENFLAVAEAPQEGRNGPNVQPICANGQQMAGNALQLSHEHTDIVQTRWQVCEPHELFHGQYIAQLLAHSADIVHTVSIGNHLRIGHRFSVFFEAAVQIPNMRPDVLHQLSVQRKLQPQHAVSTGMLRSHLQDEVITLPFVANTVFISARWG
jgi:hypothetical protein